MSAEIALQTIPADAAILVDGNPVPQGVRTLPRPAVGRTVTVVMQAPGHDDASLQVDYFTSTPVVVTLRPTLELDAPAAVDLEIGDAAAAVPVPSAMPTPKAAPPKPRANPATALPDNPY